MVKKPQGVENCAEQAAEVCERVQEWQAAFKGAVSERLWEKVMEDLDKLIKPEDIEKFSTSQVVRKAVAVSGEHLEKDASKTPNQTD